MKNDEIYAIWSGYVRSDYMQNDPVYLRTIPIDKPIRLTPMEIFHLVEELLNRLEIKEGKDEQIKR